MDWRNGQDRRAWLDRQGQNALDSLQYYLGPGVNVNALATLGDMFNPVADIGRAGTAARGVVRPGATVSERVNALGNVATDMASVLAPVGGAAYADDAARGLSEALANWSMPADDMATRFVASEAGSVGPRSAAEARGAEVLDMLKSGRASEVTDDMLDLGDPVLNAQLNDYLFRNYDLPMDEASRMARAEQMGFDTEFPMHHGSVTYDGEDAISAFRPGPHDETVLTGTAFAYDPRTTDYYSMGGRWGNEDGGTTYPAFLSSRKTDFDDLVKGLDWDASFMDEAQRRGIEAVDMSAVMGGDEVFAVAPNRIRSRFARFDPRLAHLRNLSAGVGGLGIAVSQQSEQERSDDINDILAKYGVN